MNYWIHRDGKNCGPYQLDHIKSMLEAGIVYVGELAIREGDESWSTVGGILGVAGERRQENFEFKNIIKERFPLICELALAEKAFYEGDAFGREFPEPVPLFAAFILGAMETPPPYPISFVFPHKGRSAPALAILYAMRHFRRTFPAVAKEYGESQLTTGQRVIVRPGKHVFEFDGFWDDEEDRFRLKILGQNARRTFPIEDFLRLQPTEKQRPKGKLDTPIDQYEPTPLDCLLEISSFGNLGFFRNGVLLLDTQNSFSTFVEQIILSRTQTGLPSMPPLNDLAPFGTIGDTGKLEKTRFNNPLGEPLVAVSSSPDRIVAACRRAPAKTKTVIVNGFNRIRSPHYYDDIAECQNLVIISQHSETDLMMDYNDRRTGCRFWWMNHGELLLGQDSGSNVVGPIFHPLVQKAKNWGRLKVETDICNHEKIRDTAKLLSELSTGIVDEDNALKKLTRKIWLQFNAICSRAYTPEDSILEDNLDKLIRELEENRNWLEMADYEMAREALGSCKTIIAGDEGRLTVKGERLIRLLENLGEEGRKRALLLARDTQNFHELNKLEASLTNGQSFQVIKIRDYLAAETSFQERLIIPFWPNSSQFKNLFNQFSAPQYQFLLFQHEAVWMNNCLKRQKRPSSLNYVGVEQKKKILDLENSHMIWPEVEDPMETVVGGLIADDSVSRNLIETTQVEQIIKRSKRGGQEGVPPESLVEAKAIDFVGGSYAWLTESHHVPEVTDMVLSDSDKIKKKTCSQIEPGDYVVFRESGNKDIIRDIANNMIEEVEAIRLRVLANLWKEALISSGLEAADIQQRLQSAGLQRHVATIRNWLDVNTIGPDQKDDIRIIAEVFGTDTIQNRIDEIWDVICILRGAHIKAGHHLAGELLKCLRREMGDMREDGTEIEIDGLGNMWVVQVESMDQEFTLFDRGVINRLQWPEDD